jgi:diguanylate cyclase
VHQPIVCSEFQVEYQPQVNIITDYMIGVEALVRWNHPQQGRILPGAFIPLVEATNSIRALGEWVLRRACIDFSDWQRLRPDSLKLAVNVSPQQFEDSRFTAIVTRILHETGVNPHCLMLELTETTPIHNLAAVVKTINELHRLGIKVALDDFGTGYSSLTLLQQLPIDLLKIDQTFVQRLGQDERSLVIVKSMIDLAQSLEIPLMAEGVETIEQLEILFQQGCYFIQGYLWSPALPAIDIPVWL